MRISIHVCHDFVETSNNIIRIGLLNSWLLGLLLRLLLLHLLLHLYALSHSLLHLSHHWVHRLLHHHWICCLLLHHHLHRVSLHLGLLRLLSLITGRAYQVKKIDVSRTLWASSGITRVTASVISIAFVLLTVVLSIDMAGVEQCLLGRFTRNKLLRWPVLLNGSVSLKCLMKVVVNNNARCHNTFIVNLTNHVDKFGFELSQCAEEIIERLTLLTRL